MNKSFHEKRRQQFLTSNFFDVMSAHHTKLNEELAQDLSDSGNSSEDKTRLSYFLTEHAFHMLSLRYTAGEPIGSLRADLEAVVAAYERYTDVRRASEDDPDHPPLYFLEIDEYERCMQLIGLCYLLHRRDLLPRIASMLDPNFYGHDVLYEELLDYELPGRYDTDKLFHGEPYTPLVEAMYAETDDESIDKIQQYLKNWYAALSESPWHDSHLRMTDQGGDYFGYWAFEAGALVLLLDLDDSEIDHIVYPKELVAWSRANASLSDEEPGDTNPVKLRCPAGQICPKTGYWLTPAKQGARQHFNQGDVMPDMGSNYGMTIWQWDEQQ